MENLTLVHCSLQSRTVTICLAVEIASHKSYFCVVLLVPLLAERYKFVRVIGQGQSSILIAAEVRKQLTASSLFAVQPVHVICNTI